MYELAQAYIRFDFTASVEFKEALQNYLFYKGKLYANELYDRNLLEGKLYFKVDLVEGSLKSRLHVFGKFAIGVLATYGSIRAGMDYFVDDAKRLTEHIVADIKQEQYVDAGQIGRVERRLGVPGKIVRLLNLIEYIKNNRNNISPNDQVEILERISHQYKELIQILDRQDSTTFQQTLFLEGLPIDIKRTITEFDETIGDKTQIPLDTAVFAVPQSVGIREEETEIVSEDDISPQRSLPPPK